MYQKFSRDEVKRICSAGVEKAHIFLIPIDIDNCQITFKLSYWHERGAYVAEAGIISEKKWSPAHVTAPAKLIESVTKIFGELCGVRSIAGVTALDQDSLLTTLFKTTEVPSKLK